ncbi:MAG: hypothetical protein P8130_09550, partial [Deltaproteobacteria bacterium]
MYESKKQARRAEADDSIQKTEKIQDLAAKILGIPRSHFGGLLLIVLPGRTAIFPNRKRGKDKSSGYKKQPKPLTLHHSPMF